MATAASVIQSFETYEWDAQVYGVLSLASQLAASVKSKANVLRLAYQFHLTNRSLDSLFNKVHSAMEGKIHPAQKAEPATPEQFRTAADNLIQLHRALGYTIESARRVGLLNNSLTAGALRKLGSHHDAILDLADWFHAASQQEQLTSLFDRASREKEQGDIFDLDQVN